MIRRTGLRMATALGTVALASLALTGCFAMAPAATLIDYDPAEGISADFGAEGDAPTLEFRNVQAVADDDLEAVNIAFVVVNSGDPVQLAYSAVSDSGRIDDTVTIPSGRTQFGLEDDERIVIEAPDTALGALYSVTFTPGDLPSQTLQVPVLNTSGREYLEALLP